MSANQYVFKKDNQFFLVDIWESGGVTLKVKEQGWSDTWSLSLEPVSNLGQRLEYFDK
jgi:hypothetical protein